MKEKKIVVSGRRCCFSGRKITPRDKVILLHGPRGTLWTGLWDEFDKKVRRQSSRQGCQENVPGLEKSNRRSGAMAALCLDIFRSAATMAQMKIFTKALHLHVHDLRDVLSQAAGNSAIVKMNGQVKRPGRRRPHRGGRLNGFCSA